MDLHKAEMRDIKEEDLKKILDWRNQETIRKVMYDSEIISWEKHVQWFNRQQESDTSISKIFIYDQVPIGILNVNKIDRESNKCEWGFYIGEKSSSRGMGTLLGFLSLNYIFKELAIRKLCAEVLSINERSVAFHTKLGFIQEGILRKHIRKNENYVDIVVYGLLDQEWETHSVNIERMIRGWY